MTAERQDAAASRLRALAVLAPLVGVVLVVIVYRDAYAAEDGLYAGAEPALAGLFVSSPFVALVVAQVACVLVVALADSVRARVAGAGAAVVLTLVGLVSALLLV